MTIEQPTAPRLLRRRTDDRVIGGVASGLGDFLNVDPLLIRIAFVGLMVFGGLGLLLYVSGWLLVPEESSDESIAEEALRRTGLTTTRWLVIMLFAAGLFIFLGGIGNAFAFDGLAFLGLALMVVVLGGAFLSRGGPPAPAAPAAPATSIEPSTPDTAAVVIERPRRRIRRRARPRSPLGWYVLGIAMAGIGLLALVVNVTGAEVEIGQFFGVVMAVIGLGLVVGTWWGHARILIALGILVLPLAIAATFITAPLEGGIGSHRFRPASVDELRDEYRVAGGGLFLDLTSFEAADGPIVIAASVAVGGLYVELPPNAELEIDAAVGGGELRILGEWQAGTGLTDRHVVSGAGPTFVLDLEAGVGTVEVHVPRELENN